MSYADFCQACNNYSIHSNSILRKDIVADLMRLKAQGATIYVISASIHEWVLPICIHLGIDMVIGTKVERDQQDLLTGMFSSKNCYGQEKVNRLLEFEPLRGNYYLVAYGDSRGDKEMLDFADKRIWV